MSRQIIFLVHGMGTHGSDWADDALEKLKELYENYRILNRIDFEDRFRPEVISYSEVFEEIVTNWAEMSSEILGSGQLGSAGDVKSLVKWLENAGDTEDNFLWSHVADVALYRFFPLVRQLVKVRVARQFFDLLAAGSAHGDTDWSVIAHSLGTIVTHDTLHAMEVTTPPQSDIPLLPAVAPQAQVVAMVANVSKVLENDVDVYADTTVVPAERIGQARRVCLSYLSFNNKLDIFTRIKPFDPHDVGPWEIARDNGRFKDISSIRHAYQWNAHALDHYLMHPSVHIPLFRALAGMGAITRSEMTKAQNEFTRYPSKQLKEKFEEKLSETGDGDLFDQLRNFLDKPEEV